MIGMNGFARTKRKSRQTITMPMKIVAAAAGQSNIAKWFLTPDTNGAEGKDAFLSVLNAALPGPAHNLVNGATTGSSALKSSTVGTAWWYDDATLAFGPCYNSWLAAVTPVIPDIKAILWDRAKGISALLPMAPRRAPIIKTAF
ncbi:MAG: hypothetical protein JWM96_180 [Alphaproteobacteria bacterium]|nr:hypothetical protein [Alphaproteobacteria bacterium]